MTRVYGRFIRESGLKPRQFSLLAALSLEGPLGMGALAEVMAMERTTLTGKLRPLEKDGLVEVRPGADRRTRQVACTPTGRRRLERALPAWRETQAYMARELGGES